MTQGLPHSPRVARPARARPLQVAGTVGGQNQGAGVFGALPGVKVLPIKVLSDDGYGSMSDIMVRFDCFLFRGVHNTRLAPHKSLVL